MSEPSFFRRFSPESKRGLGLTITLLLFLFLLIPSPAQADACSDCGPWPWEWPSCIVCGVEYVLTLPIRMGAFLILLPNLLLALVLGFVYYIVVVITYWVFAGSASIPVVPSKIAVVDVGWTFTSGLANIFFILVLAFIGLATILKIKDYEAKKALPRLIIIAILINFTPVIVGFIVDTTNIITHFFVAKAGMESLPTIATLLEEVMVEMTQNLADPWTIMNVVNLILTMCIDIVYSFVVVIFFAYAIYVYLLIMVIFGLRIIYLWLLMILAPIAFLSYVFPPGGMAKYFFPSILDWDKWWQELIKWAVVGIPFGFFMYLSTYMMANMDIVGIMGSIPQVMPEGAYADLNRAIIDAVRIFLEGIAAPIFGLMVLHVGYKISKEASPQAVKGAIKAMKAIGKMAGKAAATAVTGGTAGLVAGQLAGAGGRVAGALGAKGMANRAFKYKERKKREYAAKRTEVPEEFNKLTTEEKGEDIRRTSGKREKLARYAVMGKDISKLGEDQQKEAVELAEEFSDKAAYRGKAAKIAAGLPHRISANTAIALAPAHKRENVEEAIEGEKENIERLIEEGVLDEEEIEKEIRLKYDIKEDEEISDWQKQQGLRDLAAETGGAAEMSPSDIRELKDSALNSLAVRLGSRYWHGGQINQAYEGHSGAAFQEFLDNAGGLNNLRAEKLQETSPRLANYLTTHPYGKHLGWKGRQEIEAAGGYNRFQQKQEEKDPDSLMAQIEAKVKITEELGGIPSAERTDKQNKQLDKLRDKIIPQLQKKFKEALSKDRANTKLEADELRGSGIEITSEEIAFRKKRVLEEIDLGEMSKKSGAKESFLKANWAPLQATKQLIKEKRAALRNITQEPASIPEIRTEDPEFKPILEGLQKKAEPIRENIEKDIKEIRELGTVKKRVYSLQQDLAKKRSKMSDWEIKQREKQIDEFESQIKTLEGKIKDKGLRTKIIKNKESLERITTGIKAGNEAPSLEEGGREKIKEKLKKLLG